MTTEISLRLGTLCSTLLSDPRSADRADTLVKQAKRQPVSLLTALILRAHQVPRGIIEHKCFAGLTPQRIADRWRQIDEILTATPALAHTLRTHTVRQLLGTQHLATIAPPSLQRAERLVAGARMMLGMIDDHFPAAVAAGQSEQMFVGIEVEVDPRGRSGDALYKAIHQTMQATAGAPAATLITQPASYVFGSTPKPQTVMFEIIRANNRTVRLYRAAGAGGIMHRAVLLDQSGTPIGPPTSRLMPKKHEDLFSPAAEQHAYTMAARLLGLPDADAVRTIRQAGGDDYKILPTLVVKSDDGDFAYFTIDLEPGGTARIRPICAQFPQTPGADPTFRLVRATTRDEAIRACMMLIANTAMTKSNQITGLDLAGVGVMTVVNEEPPSLEAVSPKTKPGDIDTLTPAWQTLADLGCLGTTPHTNVGVHVHMHTALQVLAGETLRYSVAPMLSVYRAFFESERALRDIVPISPNRQPYITSTPAPLRRLLGDPAVMRNAEDPGEILCVLAEISRHTRKKYMALNLDKHIGALIQGMLTDGVLTPGQTIDMPHWHGRRYRFRVTAGNVVLLRPGHTPLPLQRVPSATVQSSAELRIFDTIMYTTPDGTRRIDAQAVPHWARFAAAFGWRHGNAPFVAAS